MVELVSEQCAKDTGFIPFRLWYIVDIIGLPACLIRRFLFFLLEPGAISVEHVYKNLMGLASFLQGMLKECLDVGTWIQFPRQLLYCRARTSPALSPSWVAPDACS